MKKREEKRRSRRSRRKRIEEDAEEGEEADEEKGSNKEKKQAAKVTLLWKQHVDGIVVRLLELRSTVCIPIPAGVWQLTSLTTNS